MFVGLPFQRSRGRRPAGEVLRHRLLVMKEKGRGLRLRLHFESGVELALFGVPGYLNAPYLTVCGSLTALGGLSEAICKPLNASAETLFVLPRFWDFA